jgi:hypothetical protein
MSTSSVDRKPYIFFGICVFISTVILFKACNNVNQVVSKSEYLTIKEGMTYEKVCDIIGEAGTEQASSSMPGVEGVMEGIDMKVYEWHNLDGSGISVTFHNNKVYLKAQAGL